MSVNWVVRAGVAKPLDLIKGYTEHLGALGTYGFSVQYNPGSDIDELARAGQHPNATISIATEDALQAAVMPLGYHLGFIRTPGHGYHHTCTVVYDTQQSVMQVLPQVVAEALSATFQRMPNPHRWKRP